MKTLIFLMLARANANVFEVRREQILFGRLMPSTGLLKPSYTSTNTTSKLQKSPTIILPSQLAMQKKASPHNHCTKCSTNLPADANFCMSCGARQDA